MKWDKTINVIKTIWYAARAAQVRYGGFCGVKFGSAKIEGGKSLRMAQNRSGGKWGARVNLVANEADLCYNRVYLSVSLFHRVFATVWRGGSIPAR